MAQNLNNLIRKRGIIKGQLTRLHTTLTKETNLDTDDVSMRKKNLEEHNQAFLDVQFAIENLQLTENEEENVDNLEDYYDENERSMFEKTYFECAKIINKKLRELSGVASNFGNNKCNIDGSNSRANTDRSFTTNIHSLLPKIEIVPFDGAPLLWHTFYDTFQSLVHDSNVLHSIEKFHYLKNSLKGEALNIISTLNASAENYTVAWNLLIQRYNKPRLIVQAHLKELLELTEIHKDSPANLRRLLEKAQLHVNALKAAKQDTTNWDPFLVYIITSKLDKFTRRNWERSLENEDMPKYEELIAFLQKQSRGEELDKSDKFKQNIQNTNNRRLASHIGTNNNCPICSQMHTIFTCTKFKSLSPRIRANVAREAKLCLNCLRGNHKTINCRMNGCRVCSKKHNSMLHFEYIVNENKRDFNSNDPGSEPKNVCATPEPSTSTHTAMTVSYNSEVLLGTAITTIIDKDGKEHDCRVLLDGGSQSNFITEEFANRLGLQKHILEVPFCGLGNNITKSQYYIRANIKSKINHYENTINFVALPEITGLLPTRNINRTSISIPKNIELADPDFHNAKHIDALLGNTVFYNLLQIGQIKRHHGSIILQKTKVGWIVTGKAEISKLDLDSNMSNSCLFSSNVDKHLQRFWEIEELHRKTLHSEEELACESHFIKNIRRDQLGRYIVRLPFKNNIFRLEGSFNIALKRFYSLEAKLAKDESLHKQYTDFLTEYEKLGHMTNITHLNNYELGYYLPHHAELNNLRIPRKVILEKFINIQLHGFCDASQRAYGACIYIRTMDESNNCATFLLCSKSRAAPLKTISLPRLELCAAVLLVKLFDTISVALNLKFDTVRFWSDSTITLNWINKPAYIWNTFVANRVSEIQASTNINDWCHVSSIDNPADFVSRGQMPCELINNHRWFYGPQWLSHRQVDWPTKPFQIIEVPEKRAKIALLVNTNSDNIFNKFSSLVKLNRVVAYILRWVVNYRSKNKFKGELSATEIDRAHMHIIKVTQTLLFQEEYQCLIKNNGIPNKSAILPLCPFLDDNGIMRVGGRLNYCKLNYSTKHPILLPKNCHLTELIVRYYHISNFHCGQNTTLNLVRQKYWPIDGKNQTKRLLHQCIPCRKYNPLKPKYLMGSLPETRVTQARPFENVGIDYCGPFLLKEKKFRNRNTVKSYVVIFVCFVLKAVHFELTTDLTTESCLAAIKRFFSRRGKSRNIYTDNGSNFLGAKNEIHKLILSDEFNKDIQRNLANEGVNWHLIPPRSPHFAGLWEAGVKSFKQHLYRNFKNLLFTYEEFNTIIIEIEAILNSRPLTPLSSDPNDLSPLTAGHFLIGDALKNLPEANLQELPNNQLSRWEVLQKIKQTFWKRWHVEYLNNLNVRAKWYSANTENLKIGTLVTIRDDNSPPMKWKLGRIVATHPGEDKVVRVVTIKTATGVVKRSVKYIAPLPIDS